MISGQKPVTQVSQAYLSIVTTVHWTDITTQLYTHYRKPTLQLHHQSRPKLPPAGVRAT
jgi:hypothetical protein